MKNSSVNFRRMLFTAAVVTSFASCKKTTANEYIPECENVEGTTQIQRTENCKACCIANDWDTGVYWELAGAGTTVGCECFND